MKKRCMAMLVLLLLMLSVSLSHVSSFETLASGDHGTFSGRQIHVVYDDSGSMFRTGDTPIMRWSQAKYAMEVFCAMMDENDVMTIYPMSLEGEAGMTLKGSDPGRVKALHDMNIPSSWTPIQAVVGAGEALRGAGNREKWLVVLTDGDFFYEPNNMEAGVPKPELQQLLDGFNHDCIRTVFLAIGEDLDREKLPDENPAMGAYMVHAADGSDVLKKVCAVSNQVFQKLILEERFIDRNGDSHTLHMDIPTGKVIVFAQGDNASVSDMTLGGDKLTPSVTYNVEYCDFLPLDSNGNERTDAIADETLKGILVEYEAPAGNVFEKGDFRANVSGASEVEYYYQPGVEINCELILNGVPARSEDKLAAGEYDVRMSFIDPTTGEEIESDLLQVEKFVLSVDNNGTETKLEERTGNVQLEEGSVTLQAAAHLKGNIHLTAPVREYTVVPKMIDLKLDLDPEEVSFRQDQTGDNAQPVMLTVTDAATGAKLTKEQTDAAKITVEEKGGVVWDVKPSSEPGVFELRPTSKSGKLKGLKSGDYSVAVSAEFDVDNRPAYGSREMSFSVESYKVSALEVTFGDIPDDYALRDFDGNQKPFPVNVKLLDEESGATSEVTPEAWEVISLRMSGAKLGWEIEKTATPGVFMVTPGYFHGWDLITGSGDMTVKARASGKTGELKFEGEGEADLYIEPFSLKEWIIRALPYLVPFLGILFWLLGYLPFFKHYLPGRMKGKPTINCMPSEPGEMPKTMKGKVEKNLLSTIIPYVPQRGKIRYVPKGTTGAPKLNVRAVKGKQMAVTNFKAFSGKENITFGSVSVTPETKKLTISAASTIRMEGNEWTYTCNLTQ